MYSEQDRINYLQDRERYQRYLRRENESPTILPVKVSEADLIKVFGYRRAENFRFGARQNYLIEEGLDYIQLFDKKDNFLELDLLHIIN